MSESKATTTGGRRWLLPLLIVSLSLNMIVLGAAGAMLYHHFSSGHEGMVHARGGGEPADVRLGRPGLLLRAGWRTMRKLPRQRRRELRQVIMAHRPAIRESMREVGMLRRELARILEKQPLDTAAMNNTIKRLSLAEARARASIIKMNEDFISAMSDKERKLFARQIRKAAERRWRRKRRQGMQD